MEGGELRLKVDLLMKVSCRALKTQSGEMEPRKRSYHNWEVKQPILKNEICRKLVSESPQILGIEKETPETRKQNSRLFLFLHKHHAFALFLKLGIKILSFYRYSEAFKSRMCSSTTISTILFFACFCCCR